MNTFYEVEADIDNNEEYIANPQRISFESAEWPHFHEGLEILYFTKGDGTVRINNETVTVKKGDCVVVNSKRIHSFKTSGELCYYYIILKKEFLKKYGFPYREKYVKNKFCDKEIAEYFEFICGKSKEEKEENEWFSKKATAYLILLAVKLYSAHIDESETIIDGKVKSGAKIAVSIMDCINENLQKNISLKNVAEKVGYSKYYACKIFKELTGKTVTDYINSQKCLRAAEDLKKGEYTVCEVASKYGYENFSYFSKTFKKYMGKSPSSFK